jgi:maleate isomerase
MTGVKRLRLGAIYPDDAWVDLEAQALVDEFARFLPTSVELISAATYVPAVDNTTSLGVMLAENGDIEEAARRLLPYQPDCFAYFCTTVSFIRGPGGDLDISRRITSTTGKPATTTSTAMIAALRALEITRISLASPYLPDVEQRFRDFFRAHNIEVVKSLSLCLERGHSIVPPENIRRLAESADDPSAQAVFVGCTGQRLALHLEAMESQLGKPVLTANQVTSWHALTLMGAPQSMEGRGRLFAIGQADPALTIENL